MTAIAADKGEPKKGADKLSRADAKFVRESAEGGMMEMELGKLALKKSNNDEVKAFGKQMQEDHSKVNEELMTIAGKRGVELRISLQGKYKRTVDRLAKLSGAEFDRQYMQVMVQDHKEDLKKFHRQAAKGQDPEVKQFASEQVPVLEKHLEMAQATERQVKAASKALPQGALPHPNNLKTAAYDSRSVATI
jgi:putative membrane protein